MAGHGFEAYELLTTERAIGAAPMALAEDAVGFHHVPPGPVNEAARLIDDVGGRDLVALGGGRVIDAAKAIAAVRARASPRCPRRSRAPIDPHPPASRGSSAADGLVRPAVVLADPPVMVSLPEQRLRASAMNALAHGADSLYTPLSNPVATMAALRGRRCSPGLDTDRAKRDPAQLALGSTLSAYAMDSAMFALHHVVCQTLVRTFRSRTRRPTRRCCPERWRRCARARASR